MCKNSLATVIISCFYRDSNVIFPNPTYNVQCICWTAYSDVLQTASCYPALFPTHVPYVFPTVFPVATEIPLKSDCDTVSQIQYKQQLNYLGHKYRIRIHTLHHTDHTLSTMDGGAYPYLVPTRNSICRVINIVYIQLFAYN